ncbi:MAG: ribosome maturation factor RimP [Gammaproteobacteria bacterium CG22_combo_CG10-13_8_21_14_all_40_8]|nr:MAG: ribosome maturation factor RimP [Gammaproteobacteria bacterium CG22_combo_CG10-13_8_21_14_all_40_8]
MSNISRLNEIIQPAVAASGYEFVGIEYKPAGKHSILCVYIDHENGISVDDCAICSHQISALLDVEDPIAGEYNLQVSSPGLDRPLFNAAQFQQYLGEEVKVKLHSAVKGQRNLKGKISQVVEDEISIKTESEVLTFNIHQLNRANIIPNW